MHTVRTGREPRFRFGLTGRAKPKSYGVLIGRKFPNSSTRSS